MLFTNRLNFSHFENIGSHFLFLIDVNNQDTQKHFLFHLKKELE